MNKMLDILNNMAQPRFVHSNGGNGSHNIGIISLRFLIKFNCVTILINVAQETLSFFNYN